MIAAITGGRRDAEGRLLIPSPHQMEHFLTLVRYLAPNVIRHGGAIGTDRYVAYFLGVKTASYQGVIAPFPVSFLDGPWPAAGHRRNTRMLQTAPAVSVLIAFPGGAGTANCVETGLRMGIQVWQWEGGRDEGEFREITKP